ncbi:hypothetical protein [Streptomyces sp. NBC_00063]|uniref:hypothetical protein n=1 Tax=Streptomyces sp. NBC_00063 TaxID=2975638 RepID=UPI00225B4E37|nr:hypothetical protein [Streptomyces sp. NBC_00063]MCX5441198.1 hypothetical protein [Streptomyces sp. NBC_00063]
MAEIVQAAASSRAAQASSSSAAARFDTGGLPYQRATVSRTTAIMRLANQLAVQAGCLTSGR